MLGVLRMLATAETVMKHIVSQVMVLADGMALAFAGGATAFAVASVLAMAPPFVAHPSPARAGALLHYSARRARPLRASRPCTAARAACRHACLRLQRRAITVWIPSVRRSRHQEHDQVDAEDGERRPARRCHSPRPAATPT